jgi:hypothetical protein
MQKGQKTEDQTYTKLGPVGWVLGWRHTTALPPPVSLLYTTVAKLGGATVPCWRGCDIVILWNRRNL